MATDGPHVDAVWCHSRARELRAAGLSWAQVVDVLALDQKVGPLRLYRLAHNRSASDVVDEINQRDPAASAAMRVQRLYDYEMWPGAGRRPSVWVLPVLARIYQTAARRLVTEAVYASYNVNDQVDLDAADFSHLDVRHPQVASGLAGSLRVEDKCGSAADLTVPPWQPGHTGLGGDAIGELDQVAQLAGPTNEESVELFRAVVRLESDPQRQERLFRLASVLGGVSGLPLVHKLTGEQCDRLAAMASSPGRTDTGTIQILKNVTEMCRHLDDSRGPQPVLRAVLRYRAVVAQTLGATAPAAVWRGLVQVYAELSQFAGWLLYDLGHYVAADRYFKEGLAAAQEVRDIRTIAFIHCCLTHMACFRGRMPVALDHAFAARGWASQSGSSLLASYAEQLAAWVFATEGMEAATGHALERAQKLLPDLVTADDPPYLYFVDRGFTVGFGAGCWRRLNQPKRALLASEDALALTDPALVRNRGFRLLDQAKALLVQKEIGEAARVTAEIADIAASHSSVRLRQWMGELRSQMQPWAGMPEMQRLDARLVDLNLAALTQRAAR